MFLRTLAEEMKVGTASLLVALAATGAQAAFNYSKCPSSEEFWAFNSSDPGKVPREFDMELFAPVQGAQYYELALHDWTQYPLCPKPNCIGSFKQYDSRLKQVNDTFSLSCVGGHYHPALRFDLTGTPGKLLGFWEGLPGPKTGWIPDTVLDFELTEDKKGYDWVIEIQCVEKLGHVGE